MVRRLDAQPSSAGSLNCNVVPEQREYMVKNQLEKEAEKPRVQTAARTCALLLEVAKSGPRGISAKALSEKLRVPRQIIYHLIHTLASIDMLRKLGSNRYVLGLSIAPIANGFNRQLLGSDVLNEFVHRAAEATGETAYVGGWLDGDVVVLASQRGSATITASSVPQGTAGDAHARASGKLLLAMSEKEELDSYLRNHEFTMLTPNTIVNRDEFDRELESIRQEWVGYDNEEYSLGLSCLAVPIGEAPSGLVLGISAPTERFQENKEKYIRLLYGITKRSNTLVK